MLTNNVVNIFCLNKILFTKQLKKIVIIKMLITLVIIKNILKYRKKPTKSDRILP